MYPPCTHLVCIRAKPRLVLSGDQPKRAWANLRELLNPALRGHFLRGTFMQSIIQIFKVHPVKTGTSSQTGKPYEMQHAECAMLDDAGDIDQVGVLRIPKDMRGQVVPGIYLGRYAMRPDMKTREIGPVLVGLQPYSVAAPKKA